MIFTLYHLPTAAGFTYKECTDEGTEDVILPILALPFLALSRLSSVTSRVCKQSRKGLCSDGRPHFQNCNGRRERKKHSSMWNVELNAAAHSQGSCRLAQSTGTGTGILAAVLYSSVVQQCFQRECLALQTGY